MYTPGPWRWAQCNDGLYRERGDIPQDEDWVLRYEPCEGMWLSTLNDNEEANALLIAAAPELLEALEAVSALGLQTKSYVSNMDFRDAVDNARSVIKRATGER